VKNLCRAQGHVTGVDKECPLGCVARIGRCGPLRPLRPPGLAAQGQGQDRGDGGNT
jgi:hypothetical protein